MRLETGEGLHYIKLISYYGRLFSGKQLPKFTSITPTVINFGVSETLMAVFLIIKPLFFLFVKQFPAQI